MRVAGLDPDHFRIVIPDRTGVNGPRPRPHGPDPAAAINDR